MPKITNGTKEWADYNINCALGCYNNCRYCYAKIMAKRFGRAKSNTWHKMKLRREQITKEYRKKNNRIMFPSSHDIIDIPHIQDACLTILRKLLSAGNEVLVTTKPRISVIREIVTRFFQYKPQIQFRFTITSIHDELLRFWEPNAPLFYERYISLKYAFAKDFKTSVSIEPFLDYDLIPLINAILPFCTESIWIGKMNYISRQYCQHDEVSYYEAVRKNYTREHLSYIYRILHEKPKIRFKDSIRLKLCC